MKNSRKTEKRILGIAAFAALAGLLSWWYAESSALRRTPVASVPSKTSPVAAATEPVRTASLAPAQMSAPVASPTPEDHLAPAPVPAATPEPAHAGTSTSSTAPTQAPAGSSRSTPQSPTAQTGLAAEPMPAAVALIEEPAGHDAAMDLFADRIAKLEQSTSSDPADANDARRLTEFNARAQDDEAAPQRVKVLRDRLGAWLADFPPERVDHVKLVSVECRTASCQILIAEETSDVSPQLNDAFSTAFGALVSEDWCRDLGLMPQSIAMHAAGSGADGKPDHALWTIYLADIASG